MLLQLLLVILIIGCFLLTRRNKRTVLVYNQVPSDIPRFPIIGHLYAYLGSSEDKMKTLQNHGKETTRKGGMMEIWLAKCMFIMVTDADVSEYVLKHCMEKDDLYNIMHIVTGNGSVFAPVSIWRHRRKVLAPSFNPKNLNGFVEIFSKQNRVLINKLKSVDNVPVSLWKYLSTNTLDSICESTLGTEVNAQMNTNTPFLNALDELLHVAADSLFKPWLHSNFIFTKLPLYSKVLKKKAILCDFVDEIIKEKRRSAKKDAAVDQKVKKNTLKTFVDLLIESSDENGDRGFTNLELREESVVLITAGSDTSAVAMGFTMTLLSRHPDVQEKVYQELQEVFGDSNRPLVAEDLIHLKYLEAVIKESLRLYPPGAIIARKVESDLTLPSGINIVKGSRIAINIWAMHRNPKYWGSDAEEFRPERFIEAPLKHPAAFIPFSYGPRACLGYQYAYMSMKTTLANILRCYKVLPAENPISGKIPSKNEPLKTKFCIMMRHVDNYTVHLKFRS